MTGDQAAALVAGLPVVDFASAMALVNAEQEKLEPTDRLGRIEVSEVLWAVAHASMRQRKRVAFGYDHD